MSLAVFAGIALVVAAIVVGLQIHENQAFAQQVTFPSREKVLSVTGTATTSVKPDLLNIQFGVETEATTAKEAINANNEAMTSIVTVIKNLGITEDELSTSSFNIYPVYDNIIDPKTGTYQKSELRGYKVSNILSIKTTKLSMAGNIIDAAVEAGTNRVDNVYFTLSPAKQIAVQDELLSNAVLNAKSKAEKALDPLDQKIIGVKAVMLSEFGVPPPIPIYVREAVASYDVGGKSTPIFTSDQDVTTTANVIFIIGDK
ncbi:MAG: SIMPL domain-containing protein [Nitrosopumilaceae archaeon]